MKILSFLFLFVFVILSKVWTQYKPGDILVSVNHQAISAGEFERQLKKNQKDPSVGKESVEDYFNLFVKFKIKVSAAKEAGLDTLSSFHKELKSYRDQLAKTYLTDNEAYDKLIHEAYDHTANEADVSHIMIRLSDNPTSADTLAAYQKINDIRKRIISGESFEKLARELSEDPSAKTNQGHIGFVTAFRFPYSFECASFNTKPGEISNPFRTKFGYHIIKVLDLRPSPGEVKVAHIMISVPQNSTVEKWNEGKEKIDNAYERLKKGEDFGVLAQELSDDHNSGKNNGELPWFSTGRMVPEFEAVAFSLDTPGSVSEPFKTFFGWHIIKLINKRGVSSFDQMQNNLKSKISRDERLSVVELSFINKLKKSYVWKEYKQNLTCFYQLDSSICKGKFNLPANCNLKQPLISIQDHSYTAEDFKHFLTSNTTQKKCTDVQEYINISFDKFTKNTFIAYEDAHLDKKYPDFHNLIEEYHDGILLYDIMDREVWSKASHDSAGLQNYFKQVSNKYNWGERLDATIFNCTTEEIEKKVKNRIENEGSEWSTNDQIIKEVCDSLAGNGCLKIDHSFFSKGDNPIIDSITWTPQITNIVYRNHHFIFVKVNEVRKPEPKKLGEIRGLLMADYQNWLEEEWIAGLEKKYTVITNHDLLNKITAKYKNPN